MYKITIENLESKKQEVIIIGDEYIFVGKDPNDKGTLINKIEATALFALCAAESINHHVGKRIEKSPLDKMSEEDLGKIRDINKK
jgi:hypothetical protein